MFMVNQLTILIIHEEDAYIVMVTHWTSLMARQVLACLDDLPNEGSRKYRNTAASVTADIRVRRREGGKRRGREGGGGGSDEEGKEGIKSEEEA